MELIEKLPNWLRWILVPFAVVLTFLIVSILSNLFFWFQGNMLGIGEGAWLDQIWKNILSPAITGFASVYLGVFCAPSKRKIVALVIGAILVMLGGFSLFSLLSRGDWWGVLNVVATVGGIGGAIYGVFEDKSEQNPLF
jgi:hypothetical protein